jgi:hypothetical protein
MRLLRFALIVLSLKAGVDAFTTRKSVVSTVTRLSKSVTESTEAPDDFEKRVLIRVRERLKENMKAAESERENILNEIEASSIKENVLETEIDEKESSRQLNPADEKIRLEKELAKIEKKKELLKRSLEKSQSREELGLKPAAATIGLTVGAFAYGRSKLEQRRQKVEEQEQERIEKERIEKEITKKAQNKALTAKNKGALFLQTTAALGGVSLLAIDGSASPVDNTDQLPRRQIPVEQFSDTATASNPAADLPYLEEKIKQAERKVLEGSAIFLNKDNESINNENDASATRQAKIQDETNRRTEEKEAKRLKAQQEEVARIKLEEETRIAAKKEAARVIAEEEARMKSEEDARVAAEKETARLQAEKEARVAAEQKAARIRAEEKARIAAEQKAVRLRAEEEARVATDQEANRLRAKEEARIAADQKAYVLRAEEQARITAEQDATKVRAEEGARIAAEIDAARLRTEEEARITADQKASRIRAEEEARITAEQDATRLRVEEEARTAAEIDAARLRAEEEARIATEQKASRIRAELETRIIAEEEATKFQAEEKARAATELEAIKLQAEEVATKLKKQEEARIAAEQETAILQAEEEGRVAAEQGATKLKTEEVTIADTEQATAVTGGKPDDGNDQTAKLKGKQTGKLTFFEYLGAKVKEGAPSLRQTIQGKLSSEMLEDNLSKLKVPDAPVTGFLENGLPKIPSVEGLKENISKLPKFDGGNLLPKIPSTEGLRLPKVDSKKLKESLPPGISDFDLSGQSTAINDIITERLDNLLNLGEKMKGTVSPEALLKLPSFPKVDFPEFPLVPKVSQMIKGKLPSEFTDGTISNIIYKIPKAEVVATGAGILAVAATAKSIRMHDDDWKQDSTSANGGESSESGNTFTDPIIPQPSSAFPFGEDKKSQEKEGPFSPIRQWNSNLAIPKASARSQEEEVLPDETTLSSNDSITSPFIRSKTEATGPENERPLPQFGYERPKPKFGTTASSPNRISSFPKQAPKGASPFSNIRAKIPKSASPPFSNKGMTSISSKTDDDQSENNPFANKTSIKGSTGDITSDKLPSNNSTGKSSFTAVEKTTTSTASPFSKNGAVSFSSKVPVSKSTNLFTSKSDSNIRDSSAESKKLNGSKGIPSGKTSMSSFGKTSSTFSTEDMPSRSSKTESANPFTKKSTPKGSTSDTESKNDLKEIPLSEESLFPKFGKAAVKASSSVVKKGVSSFSKSIKGKNDSPFSSMTAVQGSTKRDGFDNDSKKSPSDATTEANSGSKISSNTSASAPSPFSLPRKENKKSIARIEPIQKSEKYSAADGAVDALSFQYVKDSSGKFVKGPVKYYFTGPASIESLSFQYIKDSNGKFVKGPVEADPKAEVLLRQNRAAKAMEAAQNVSESKEDLDSKKSAEKKAEVLLRQEKAAKAREAAKKVSKIKEKLNSKTSAEKNIAMQIEQIDKNNSKETNPSSTKDTSVSNDEL